VDLIDFVISFFIVYFIVNFCIGMVNGYNALRKEQLNELMKSVNSMVHQVKIEQHGEIEYWYDEDTDSFLGQGRTKEEIIDKIKDLFPTHIFLLKDIGGIAAQTEWKIMAPEPFGKIQFDKELFVND
jgi:hypothetical protein